MADLHSPAAEIGEDDPFDLLGAPELEVDEQHHVLAQAGDDNHPIASRHIGQPHRYEIEGDRPIPHLMGLFVDIGDRGIERFAQACREVAHQYGDTVFEVDVAGLELSDDPAADTQCREEDVKVAGVKAAIEQPDGMLADVLEHGGHSAADDVVPAGVFGA